MQEEIRRATILDVEVLALYNAAMAHETEGKTLSTAILRRGVEAVFADLQTVHPTRHKPVGSSDTFTGSV